MYPVCAYHGPGGSPLWSSLLHGCSQSPAFRRRPAQNVICEEQPAASCLSCPSTTRTRRSAGTVSPDRTSTGSAKPSLVAGSPFISCSTIRVDPRSVASRTVCRMHAARPSGQPTPICMRQRLHSGLACGPPDASSLRARRHLGQVTGGGGRDPVTSRRISADRHRRAVRRIVFHGESGQPQCIPATAIPSHRRFA